MNKPIKAKNLPLFSIIDLDQLRRENHLEGTEVTDFFTARDGKVYLLMEQPSETQGKDWLSTPSTYTAVEIQLDWAEQRVLETTLFPLGLLKFQFHYLRPAGDHFLLLGARCAYRENGPDQNAWIVSRDGAVLSRFCLGDGIQDCVVKKDGTIITSYFDEGVFGNYGWDEPLGACGLIAWTSEGTPLWKNENYSIYDCYAISLDEEEMLGADFSQIDFLFDNTAMALAELYFQWKDNSKLDYDHEEAIWDKVTGFTASKEALAFLLRQLTDIKNEVPDEDGIREIVDLWKNEDSGEIAPAWSEHLDWLIKRLISEQEA